MYEAVKLPGIFMTLLFVAIYSLAYMASDIYFPAMPAMALHFHSSIQNVQYTVSAYMLGLALGQLIYGSISDLYGRKLILLLGFSLFTICSLLIFLVNRLDLVILIRFFQAVGAASGAVVIRAYIYDCYGAENSAKVFSIVLPIVSISPAIMPPLGGVIAHYFGWRPLFFLMFLCGATILFFINKDLKGFKRTSVRADLGLVGTFFKMAKSTPFFQFAILPCVTFFIYFAYIVEAPFVFSKHGYGSITIGLSYITFSMGYLFGAYLAKYLLRFLKKKTILMFGYVLFFIGGLLMALISWRWGFSPVGVVVPMTITTVGNGFVMPISFSQIMASFPNNAGSASSLTGATQLFVAFVATCFINDFTRGSVYALSGFVLMVSFVGFVFFFVLFRPKMYAES